MDRRNVRGDRACVPGVEHVGEFVDRHPAPLRSQTGCNGDNRADLGGVRQRPVPSTDATSFVLLPAYTAHTVVRSPSAHDPSVGAAAMRSSVESSYAMPTKSLNAAVQYSTARPSIPAGYGASGAAGSRSTAYTSASCGSAQSRGSMTSSAPLVDPAPSSVPESKQSPTPKANATMPESVP